MNVVLALTAIHHGAVAANHVEVIELLKERDGPSSVDKICGARVRDTLTNEIWEIKAKVVSVFVG